MVNLNDLPRAVAGRADWAARWSCSRRLRVLVVDDREDVRVMTCQIVRQLGYEALSASSGVEALEVAQRENVPIPLLLTDVLMPGMNGRELAEQMQRRVPGVKVVFMSGYTDSILAESGTVDATALFLQKPFTPADVAAVLRRAEQQ